MLFLQPAPEAANVGHGQRCEAGLDWERHSRSGGVVDCVFVVVVVFVVWVCIGETTDDRAGCAVRLEHQYVPLNVTLCFTESSAKSVQLWRARRSSNIIIRTIQFRKCYRYCGLLTVLLERGFIRVAVVGDGDEGSKRSLQVPSKGGGGGEGRREGRDGHSVRVAIRLWL